jgi:hypothetical protein
MGESRVTWWWTIYVGLANPEPWLSGGLTVEASAVPCPLADNPMTFAGPGYSARLGAVMREAAAYRGGNLARVLVVGSSSFGARWWRPRVTAGLRRLSAEYEAHDGMPTPESVALLTDPGGRGPCDRRRQRP